MRDLTEGHGSIQNAARAIRLIRACLAAISEGLDNMEGANETVKEQTFMILMPYMDDFITWLRFCARKSSLAIPEFPPYFGTSSAAGVICTLLKTGDVYLEKDLVSLRRLVEFVLWAWTQDVEAEVAEGEVEPQKEYEERVFSRINAMVSCLQRETTMDIMLETLDLRDSRYHRRFVQASCRRCQDWANHYRSVYQEDPQKVECIFFRMIVQLSVKLSRNAGVFRALRKCKFPVFAMSIAMEFADARMSHPENQGTPIPAEVLKFFLRHLIYNANDTLRLIPGLLNAGLLEVLIKDFLLYSNGQQPLYNWAGDENTPLESLAHNCHPLIVGALQHAATSLLSETVRAIASNRQVLLHWQNLIGGFKIYKVALAKYRQHSDLDVRLCDNLEVTVPFMSPNFTAHSNVYFSIIPQAPFVQSARTLGNAHGAIRPCTVRRRVRGGTGI